MSKDWLLLKHRDRFASTTALPDVSVLSGRTVQEVRDGESHLEEITRALKQSQALKRDPKLANLSPMLCQAADEVPDGKEWIYEIKYDGYRLLSEKRDSAICLQSRRGHDVSAQFPEIVRALKLLPCQSAIFDGEVIVEDERGRSHFERLARRAKVSRPADIARAEIAEPVRYAIFDLLAFGGFDLRPLPLILRKQLLRR